MKQSPVYILQTVVAEEMVVAMAEEAMAVVVRVVVRVAEKVVEVMAEEAMVEEMVVVKAEEAMAVAVRVVVRVAEKVVEKVVEVMAAVAREAEERVRRRTYQRFPCNCPGRKMPVRR